MKIETNREFNNQMSSKSRQNDNKILAFGSFIIGIIMVTGAIIGIISIPQLVKLSSMIIIPIGLGLGLALGLGLGSILLVVGIYRIANYYTEKTIIKAFKESKTDEEAWNKLSDSNKDYFLEYIRKEKSKIYDQERREFSKVKDSLKNSKLEFKQIV